MKIIDTKGNILTGDNHPSLKIGDKLYTIDDRKSTMDEIRKMQQSNEGDKDYKILELAMGKDNAKEILAMDLTFQGYQNLTFYIMSAITGVSYEKLKEESGLKN